MASCLRVATVSLSQDLLRRTVDTSDLRGVIWRRRGTAWRERSIAVVDEGRSGTERETPVEERTCQYVGNRSTAITMIGRRGGDGGTHGGQRATAGGERRTPGTGWKCRAEGCEGDLETSRHISPVLATIRTVGDKRPLRCLVLQIALLLLAPSFRPSPSPAHVPFLELAMLASPACVSSQPCLATTRSRCLFSVVVRPPPASPAVVSGQKSRGEGRKSPKYANMPLQSLRPLTWPSQDNGTLLSSMAIWKPSAWYVRPLHPHRHTLTSFCGPASTYVRSMY